MRRRRRALGLAAWLLAACLAALPGAPRAAAGEAELLIFAAASMSDALTEVGGAFTAATGEPVAFNFAGSNILARQIEAGAPADLFISADLAQVERVERAGRSRPGERRKLLASSLVVVVPAGEATGPLTGASDLLAFRRLALADPAGVPAGVYARAWLERAGVWQRLAPRVVPALDVRAALAAVASGDVPAGVVYATDAAGSRRVRVVYRVPLEEAPEVAYYAAPMAAAARHPGVEAFLRFLCAPEAAAILRRHGFGEPAAGGACAGGS